MLKAYLLPGRSNEALVEGANAPLGTLSARIHACHALGLLDDENYRTLDLLRKIRNEFAHDWTKLTCESPSIRARIERLPVHPLGSTPRKQIALTILTLHSKLLMIAGLCQTAAKDGRKPGLSELDASVREIYDRVTLRSNLKRLDSDHAQEGVVRESSFVVASFFGVPSLAVIGLYRGSDGVARRTRATATWQGTARLAVRSVC